MIKEVLAQLPVVAILRGVKPQEIESIGNAIYAAGVRCIEVPLNSPSPFDSITRLRQAMPEDCLSGAGTVLTAKDVVRVQEAGGQLVVTPNTQRSVIEKALSLSMQVMPGVGTATEAFEAVDSGAQYLKLFPASTYGTGHLKALLAVLPRHVSILAVGGAGPDNFAQWMAAGAKGFGIASELYRAGDSLDQVKGKIDAIVEAIKQAKAR